MLKPLHDRVLVKRDEEQETTQSGLFIPDGAKEKPMQGVVIATGDGRQDRDGKHIPLNVKEGDRILFGRHAGQDVRVDGEDFVVMREDEIIARMTTP